MYNCIIVDDDPFSLENLANLLEDHSDLQIIRKINKSLIAIKYIITLRPDVVFLDIDMPEKDGIEILNEINDLDIATNVIFITAHSEYIIDAFKKKAFDYLMKPVAKKDLDETLDRFKNPANRKDELSQPNKSQKGNKRITFRNTYGTTFMETDNILYIQAEGCYTNIYDINNKHEVISRNIGKIEEQFPDDQFFKISRSAMVNMQYVSRIDRVKRLINLQYNGNTIQLKASRNRLYDLERKIRDFK